MKLIKCSKPKGHKCLNLYFSNIISAENYVNNLKETFLLNKAKMLEYPLSKRKRKIIKFAKPNKYILTKEGSKYLLWEKLN